MKKISPEIEKYYNSSCNKQDLYAASQIVCDVIELFCKYDCECTFSCSECSYNRDCTYVFNEAE